MKVQILDIFFTAASSLRSHDSRHTWSSTVFLDLLKLQQILLLHLFLFPVLFLSLCCHFYSLMVMVSGDSEQ